MSNLPSPDLPPIKRWPPGRDLPTFRSESPWNANLHTHSLYCDGKKSPRKYAVSACDNGLSILGFSGHAPIPYPPGADDLGVSWCTSLESLHYYLEAVRELRTEFSGRLSILQGMEVDYIPHILGPAHPTLKIMGLDYIIGSVHVAGRRPDGTIWTVDCRTETFRDGVDTIFGGSIEQMVKEYYRRIREMVTNQPPDIVGHLDLVKKNNQALQFLDEAAGWYRAEVFETLDAIAQAGCIVEVNTGGMAREYTQEPYPSLFILQRCRELGIPVAISSDAHSPKKITAFFDVALNRLKEAGY
ncbi:histidinol-phosphatase [bacterium]|nr:histidinol-phosphatase [candidate division CSSED10-310 bacterium]